MIKPEKKECRKCEFYFIDDRYYRCRRYPPTLIAYQQGVMSQFPQMYHPWDWCGEFKKREDMV